MNLTYILPLLVGMAGILQGGINRNMSETLGLAHALMLGNFLVLLYTALLYFGVLKSPDFFPEFFRVKTHLLTFKWWYVIPSVCGFIIVLGIPLGISQLGAVKVTVLIVAAQMLTSIVWDIFVEKLPVNTMKGAGMLLSLISVACTLKS